jgi:hypothetical protein
MLSITQCNKALNRNGITYSQEEIELLREVLYKVAEVCHKTIKNKSYEKDK